MGIVHELPKHNNLLGTTILFSLPNRPCCHRIYCLYTACRKFSLFRLLLRTNTSSLYLIESSKTFASNTNCLNRFVLDIQGLLTCVQHLFSCCVGIITQCWQLHQCGGLLPGSGPDLVGIYHHHVQAHHSQCLHMLQVLVINNSMTNILKLLMSMASTIF